MKGRNYRSKGLVPLGPLEAELLSVLWTVDEKVTIRQVYEIMRLRHSSEPPAYTTVATVLGHLSDKGYVRRRMNKDKAFVFMPVQTRREVVLAVLGAVRDALAEDESALWAECCKEIS